MAKCQHLFKSLYLADHRECGSGDWLIDELTASIRLFAPINDECNPRRKDRCNGGHLYADQIQNNKQSLLDKGMTFGEVTGNILL